METLEAFTAILITLSLSCFDNTVRAADTLEPDGYPAAHENVIGVAATDSSDAISLDRDYYTCSSVVSISLFDGDLEGGGTQEVTLTTSAGDYEIVLLTETDAPSGVFTVAISTTVDDVTILDGIVQLNHNHVLSVVYHDEDDGTGSPAVAMDSAVIDCEPPVLSNVQVATWGTAAEMTFETDEPTIGRVQYGLMCDGQYTVVSDNTGPARAHVIQLTGLPEETTYYFVVDANDGGPFDGTVSVIGFLTSGQRFRGTDTIKIVTNSLKYRAILASHWLETDCGRPDWCGGFDLDQDSVVNFGDFALFDGCCIEVIY